MKAVTTQGYGFNSKLVLAEQEKPKVGPRELLVEVYGSSVNPKDWKLNLNLSSFLPRLGGVFNPFIIGDDLAGIVVEKGAAVKGFEVGDRVYGMDMALGTAACAEYAVIKAHRVALMPNALDFVQAGSMPLAALTALQGLRVGKLSAGEKVLIIGASGGVGTFAVQIAKALGATVVGVCSGKNVALVKSLGADKVIDYTARDYLSEQGDFDVVFDVTSYQSLSACQSLLKEKGIYVTTGGDGKAYLNLLKDKVTFFTQGFTRQVNQKSKLILVDSNTRDLQLLADYVTKGVLTPVLDSVYAMEDIRQAYLRSKTGRAVGKIAIDVKASLGTAVSVPKLAQEER